MYPTVIQAHDDELRQHVIESLVAHGVVDWEQLNVTVASSVLVIAGRLLTPRDKAICLACCKHVAGVMHVVDHLTIRRKRPREPTANEQNSEPWYS